MPRKRTRKSGLPLSADDQAKATKIERFKRWDARRARAQELRKAWENDYMVEEGEKFFLGKQGVGDREPMINRFAATLKTRRPNLFFAAPRFFVRPTAGRREPVAAHVARQGEGVLDAIAKQDDHLERAAALAVTQAHFRLGALKVTHDPTMVPNPKKGELVYQTINGMPVVDEFEEPVPEKDPLTGEPIREPDEVMTDQVYRFVWVDAANLLLPDEGADPLRWSYIGEEVVVTLEEAKDDPRFKAHRAEIRSNTAASRPRQHEGYGARRSRIEGADEEMFRYYEFYDMHANRLLIWADDQPFRDFLVDEPVPGWIDGHPYALLPLGEPILGPEPSPWPVPVVYDWLPIQREYNIRRRQIMEGAKRSARKGVYFEGTFPDEDEQRKFMESSRDMEFAKASSPELVPVVVGDRDLSPVIYQDIMLLDNDWRFITGQPAARAGIGDADTATEAGLMERAANLRDSDEQKAVTRWMSEAGRKMLQCVKDTLTLEMWVALREFSDREFQDYLAAVYHVPPDQLQAASTALPGLKEALRARIGQQKWLRVTRQQLTFEADVTVAPGSTRPKNLDTERTSWERILTVFGAAPQLLMSRELTMRTLKMYDMEDEALADELGMLAQKMVEVNANQAGRNQGGGAAAGGGDTGQQTGGANTDQIMAAMMAGGGA